MTTKVPLIGFDRYVDITWCRCAMDATIAQEPIEVVREQVAAILPGKESQRKTLDVIKRLSTKPFDHLTDFIERGLSIYRNEGNSAVLPFLWGASIASYPFFGKTAETTGRLLSLQGDCSIHEIQRRIAEQYGDRSGVERAVSRVLQSQGNWNTLTRDTTNKRISAKQSTIVSSDELTAWLIEAVVRYADKPISVSSLQTLPVLFPFILTCPVSYIVSNSPCLRTHSEGPSNQLVGLHETL